MEPDDPRWRALVAYEIGPSDAALTFVARLARENRWTVDFATRVLNEYRRFCYLALVAGHEVTPSDEVDQAWHLHLTYSRDYWDTFCPHVLGKKLHHGPTQGGASEHTRYFEQYARTLASYERVFGDIPPVDIWPSAARRFGMDPLAFRVHPDRVFVAGRKAAIVFAGLLLLAGFLLGLVVGRAQ